MPFIIIILSLALLIVLISRFKVNAFLSFLIVSILAGIALGIPLENLPKSVNNGIAAIMGDLTLIIVLGAMLGKLVAESGAAQKIADVMVNAFGTKHIQWGLMVTGFIVGIPLFYGIGFILLVPLIFSIVYKYKLPAVYIGLPMLAALSVTHGFLPPHPSPVALVSMFEADMGLTLIYGLAVAIPSIILAGPVFSKTLKNIKSGPVTLFEQKETNNNYGTPGKFNSFITATLPVFLLIIVTVIPYCFPKMGDTTKSIVSFVGAPSIVMLLAVIVATYSLGISQGRKMKDIMEVYGDAVKDIAMILLIIAGAGIFKQIMEDSGVSQELANVLKQLPIHPLILGWLIAAIIRGCVGSATVAALTAAGVIMPLVAQSGVNPCLMVLSLGAGSLMFSHVNDAGFWMFKEYFNLSMKDTLRSWSVMEAIVSVMGLLGVLLLSLIVK
ncbi:Gnt-I system high-affinity gluconate transporter [Dysgonomonas sp. PFB1-18]|uniref:gluconate:H+ symporter n=1 Tax=unclassified Dysgonomonas TaxID=2630389 RepID=UPI00247413A1|nr:MULTISPECIES: gluconate:H+ symporter [unclassified Dysgonomonas]MDH6307347.1 Gnt-I system high-affinity gluconate transporter [Dysgonomonas sp. PF1-14]MDH6337265.1 Gnt-I system high-affinity gluconate transporter [Dysgonomonas sp. PF1-16]MDH6379189.1 Gnt-I system high-affinity gluconate transporter [Dysgonomonas sp. PFB1-18]MDH6396173.1 Gnt-I system high-affinity gluconate transporter [Dysgonomonas sp. PF1-23]